MIDSEDDRITAFPVEASALKLSRVTSLTVVFDHYAADDLRKLIRAKVCPLFCVRRIAHIALITLG